jgi:acetolactate synthase-1/2/3 large subunit
MSGADLVASYVQAAGTGYIFAYPGDPIIGLLESARQRGLQVKLARREASAAFMAEAHGMMTGAVGTCLSTLGPGSSALVNGVAAATLDRAPVLAISGQIERSREQFFTHQVLDHRALYSPITKWAGTLEPTSAPTILRKAVRTALAERPGAVHLSCPSDVLSASVEADVRIPPSAPNAGALNVYTAGGMSSGPSELLRRATRPVMLAGIGAVRAAASEPMVRLAEEAGIPVIVSGMAKGVFPEDHPYFAGVLDMACNQVVWKLLRDSDLIVCVGFDPVELIKPWTVTTPVLHIDAVPNTDQIYFSECEVVGDIALALEWLISDWKGEARWSAAAVAGHMSTLWTSYYEGRVAGRLNPTDVIDTLTACLPIGTIATCDVGSHKLLVGQGWKTYTPRTMLMTNGLSSMGFGLPAAIAAAFIAGKRPVVAIIGDGGFAMTATELRLASSCGIGIIVVVINDGSLNRIELKQAALGYPSTATRLEHSDVVGIARALDCDGARADTVDALSKCLAGVDRLTRPLVIEATVDPSQYQAQF